MQNPAIVVPAYNRPASLLRLLESLLVANIPREVTLVISIDKGGPEAVGRLAENFSWPFGDKKVIIHEQHLGLKEHVLKCGDLAMEYGQIIMLEDDLFVSPAFYSFAMEASQFYEKEEMLAGISLYRQHYHYITHFPFIPLADGCDVYFLQLPCSWGQLWRDDQWRAFRNWLKDHDDASLEKISAPRRIISWGTQSWKKLFALYLISTKKYIAYPRVSYSTNFGDAGTHNLNDSDHFQVALQMRAKPFNFLPFADCFAVYDPYLECLPSKLKIMAPFLKEYDFETDLNGCKPMESFTAAFVLSCRTSSDPLITFGLRLKPWELNVIYKISGKELFFSPPAMLRDSALERLKRNAKRQNYFYIHASLKQLIYFIFTGFFRKLTQRRIPE